MFTLPELPFSKNSMPNFCSANTFDFHHGKHHAGYVSKLNDAINGTELADKTLEEVIQASHQAGNTGVFNNSAQHFNHSFFWNSISPDGGNDPSGKLQESIQKDFGSVDNFRTEFTKMSITLFGSGWVWLVQDSTGKLEILPMPNAGTPLTEGKSPLLTLDVWEHAYYLDFQNLRAKYVEEYWHVVNWEQASSLLK